MRVRNCIKYVLLIVLFYCLDSLPANLINNDGYKIQNDAGSIITESIENKYVPDKDGYMEESINDSVIPTNEFVKDATAGATAQTTPDSANSSTNRSLLPFDSNEPIIFTFLNYK